MSIYLVLRWSIYFCDEFDFYRYSLNLLQITGRRREFFLLNFARKIDISGQTLLQISPMMALMYLFVKVPSYDGTLTKKYMGAMAPLHSGSPVSSSYNHPDYCFKPGCWTNNYFQTCS